MRRILKFLAAIFFVLLFVWGFLASCIQSTTYGSEIVQDGLGRILVPAPYLMRYIFNANKLWAGWLWFLGDLAIFLGGIGIGAVLIKAYFREKEIAGRPLSVIKNAKNESTHQVAKVQTPAGEVHVHQYDLDEEINKFIDESQIAKERIPEFVLIMGLVGAGKTTLRERMFANGYVVIDAGQIFINLGGTEADAFGENFEEPMDAIGYELVRKAIKERRNIVTEVIGCTEEEITPLIAAMKYRGYKTNLQFVDCEVQESLRRHDEKVSSDPNYISTFLSQDYHKKWILDVVENLEAGQ